MKKFESIKLDNFRFRLGCFIFAFCYAILNAFIHALSDDLGLNEWQEGVFFIGSFGNMIICLLFMAVILEYGLLRPNELRSADALVEVIGEERLKELLIAEANSLLELFDLQTAQEQRLRSVDGLSADDREAIATMEEKVEKHKQRTRALRSLVAVATGLGDRGIPHKYADLAKWDGRPIDQKQDSESEQAVPSEGDYSRGNTDFVSDHRSLHG